MKQRRLYNDYPTCSNTLGSRFTNVSGSMGIMINCLFVKCMPYFFTLKFCDSLLHSLGNEILLKKGVYTIHEEVASKRANPSYRGCPHCEKNCQRCFLHSPEKKSFKRDYSVLSR